MTSLFFTFWYPTDTKPQLGIFIREQALALACTGVQVTVVHINVQQGSGLLKFKREELNDEGTRLIRLSFTGALWNWFYNIPMWQLYVVGKRLKEVGIDATSFDVIHSHVVHPASALAHQLFKDTGKPHFISEHWSGVEAHLKNHPFGSWAKKAYQNARSVLVVSEYLKTKISGVLPTNVNIEVVPNVVNSEEFNFQPSEAKNEFGVVMVSNWNKGRRQIKRPELVIEAIGRIQNEVDKPIKLTLIGDGDRLLELKGLAEHHNVSMTSVGHLNKSEIAKNFQQASVLAHASNHETFCIVIAEAHKCGLPVVASNVAAIPELINEHNGILVENSIESWANGLKAMVNSNFDRHLIASDAALKFSIREVGEKILSIYKSLNN